MSIPYIPAQRGSRPGRAWRAHAACADCDPRMFFPAQTTGWAEVVAQADKATAVCADCPVRAACLDWALATGQRSGVWGGRLFVGGRPFRSVQAVVPGHH